MIKKITIQSQKDKQVINITQKINQIIQKESPGSHGSCVLFCKHTSCGITTADLDDGTDQDYLDAIDTMFPEGNYRHPHDPDHVGDHIMSSLIGSNLNLVYVNKQLDLGTWQEVVLIELNGPRKRQLVLSF